MSKEKKIKVAFTIWVCILLVLALIASGLLLKEKFMKDSWEKDGAVTVVAEQNTEIPQDAYDEIISDFNSEK